MGIPDEEPDDRPSGSAEHAGEEEAQQPRGGQCRSPVPGDILIGQGLRAPKAAAPQILVVLLAGRDREESQHASAAPF